MKVTVVVLLSLLAAAQARSVHPSGHHQITSHRALGPEELMPQIGSSVDLRAPRIVSGSTASRGQFPYQAAIYLDGRSFCAGSLISTRWVLTAAQCAYGISIFTIYLGANNLGASETGRLAISTRAKIVHAGFSTQTLANDIALINLGQDISLSSYIQVVPLAPGGTTVVANGTVRLTGWSSSSRDNAETGSLLKYADMVIVPNSECTDIYGNSLIRTSTLCAKFADGRSTCNMGAGSPLVDVQSKKQIGVLSYWHRVLCSKGAPVVFTRVASFAAWISANTGIAIARARLALLL